MMKLQQTGLGQQLTWGSLHLDATKSEHLRNESIGNIIVEMLGVRREAMNQQIRLNALQVDAAEADRGSQMERVKNVNQVIDTVRNTLEFRLEQEKNVANAIKKIKQKFQSAITILDSFKVMSRMQFSTLMPEQLKRGIKLIELVGDIEDHFEDHDFDIAGNLLYTCGVISYYDEDIVGARTYLDRAATYKASDHQSELDTNKAYRRLFAFIHYFRALIHKNWGDLFEASHEIDESLRLLKEVKTEFLTPTTKAEILSYISGSEHECQSMVSLVLGSIQELATARDNEGATLDRNQIRLRNRLLILLGNTYFVRIDYKTALSYYSQAITHIPEDYYALASAAQCFGLLGEVLKERETYQLCLAAIEHSGDFIRMRERMTRAVIAVLGAIGAKRVGELAKHGYWTNEARELLESSQAVEDLSPKFSSPFTKRLVSSADLLAGLIAVSEEHVIK